MKKILVAAIAVAALAACHKADDTSNSAANADAAPMAAADNGASVDTSNRANPPIAADQTRQTDAAAPGHNSFTQSQAMGHLTNAGYTNVTGMAQDDKGVWHGQATDKSGKTVAVSVDYQGSITTQ
jgi:Peptidase propeptide and YPEB domain